MFFARAARVVAILVFVLAVGQVLLGVGIATGVIGPYEVALARYAPSASTSGEVIDRGTYGILFAIALGTLAEVGYSVRKMADRD